MKRKAISSVYGFIMIFLLTMASLQSWSSAVGSMASVEGASNQGHQLQQMQGIEHLVLKGSEGNLTILNNGEVPSTVELLRFVGQNTSKVVSLGVQVPVGSHIVEPLLSGYSVEAVTALGNVFTLWPIPGSSTPIWTGTAISGSLSNMQLYQSSYDSSFFLAAGPSVFEFSGQGAEQWTFSAGDGTVTGVMPLSNGDVYVSVGYGTDSNRADLFKISPSGVILDTYPVRLFQTPGGVDAPSLVPVSSGEDATVALYDGWFYSSSGPQTGVPSDLNPLLGADSSNFYFYSLTTNSYDSGSCSSLGNELTVTSYAVGVAYVGGSNETWRQSLPIVPCNPSPQQLVDASAAGGVVSALFDAPAYVGAPMELYAGANPDLVILSDAGAILYSGQAPRQGYSSIANNGTTVYMALPQASEIQVFSAASDAYSTYPVGLQASDLIFEYGHLFAISDDEVQVFDPSMNLQKTIVFAPLSLASFSDTSQLQNFRQPSFLVLNSTSCAALLTNSTGYTSLTVERYV